MVGRCRVQCRCRPVDCVGDAMKLHTKTGGEHVDFTDSEYDDQPEKAADLIGDVLLALLLGVVMGAVGWMLWPLLRWVM